MLSIDLFQHWILCLVSVIIITSGLDNFPVFPFISDTKEGGGGGGGEDNSSKYSRGWKSVLKLLICIVCSFAH